MQIKVGKTYKNGNGRERFVEALLKYPRIATHPYMVSNLDVNGNVPWSNGFDWYNEAGELYGRLGVAEHLLPNTVKREGYIGLFTKSVPLSITNIACGGNVYTTLEEAKRQQPHADYYTKVEWEEEEV